MRRSTLACFSGMAGLLAVASSGCEDWKHVLDGVDLPDTGGGTKPGTMTGSAGASGGSVKCDGTMGPNGQSCKTCWDASGMVVRQECSGPTSTGTAGSTGTTTPQMCTKLEDGGGTSCKDAATWKRYGVDACNAQNLVFSDYALGPACDGGYQSVTYVCCGPSMTTPPPPPPSGMCIRMQQGDSTSCKDAGIWKQSGYEACLAQKMTLTDYTLGPACEGGYQSATFVCCYTPPPPPPPPPPVTQPGMCTRIQDGGATSCKDPGTWKQYGWDACQAQNMTLTDYVLGESCDGGNYRTVTYVCCASSPPPVDMIKCGESTDASGRPCKACYDQNGKIVSTDCMSPTPGAEVKCQSSTNETGAVCKTCTDAMGNVVSAGCEGGGTTTDPTTCAERKDATGAICKVCLLPDGTRTSSCPTAPASM